MLVFLTASCSPKTQDDMATYHLGMTPSNHEDRILQIELVVESSAVLVDNLQLCKKYSSNIFTDKNYVLL